VGLDLSAGAELVTFGVRSVSPKLAKDIPEDFDPGRLAIHRGDFTKETLLGMGGLVVGGAAAALDPKDVENPVERLRRRIFTRPETSRARALRGAAALALGIFVALSPSSPFNRGDPHRRLSGLLRHQRAARGASGKGGRGRRSSARRARPPPLPAGAGVAGVAAVSVIVAVLLVVTSGGPPERPGERAAPTRACSGSPLRSPAQRGRLRRHAQLLLHGGQPRLVHRQPAAHDQAAAEGRHPPVPD
jgi:hypothetical protein